MQEWAGHMPGLNIFVIAPEFAPYVSFGGIGTGLRGLVHSLVRRGHRVTVAIPNKTPGAIEEIVEIGGSRVLLFPVPGAENGYGTDISLDPQAAQRTAIFVRAVVDWIVEKHQSEHFDIVHAHEWPTAMALYLLREREIDITKIFTIHSLAYQGLFPFEALAWFGLGPEHATMDRLELYGRISLLKGALWAAEAITTVSPTYAREIQTPEHGELLDGVLRKRREALFGIVNGIDTTSWNPATDDVLATKFDIRDLSGKRICKNMFCADIGLDPDRPLVVSLGRLVEQKGIDWLVNALPAIVEHGANVAIAGAGDSALERLVSSAEQVFPGRVKYLGRIPDEHARRLLAAGDLLIMPSRWEPCGIVQLQALRYGTLPIGRRTGGLADTILDADERPEVANGFLFDEPSGAGVTLAIQRAIARVGTREGVAMQIRGMSTMLGWEGPARAYEAVYHGAMKKSLQLKRSPKPRTPGENGGASR